MSGPRRGKFIDSRRTLSATTKLGLAQMQITFDALEAAKAAVALAERKVAENERLRARVAELEKGP